MSGRRERAPQNRSQPRRLSLNILDAINDATLFKPFFKRPNSWAAWAAILAAIFALPMTDEQLAIYRQLTGRTEAPTQVAKEVWLCVGRRGGKSRIISLIAVWLAAFYDYREYLAPGEKGTVQIIASDRKQARTCIRFIKAFISLTPMLAEMVESETAESISLNNDIVIEVSTASFRSVRGFTVVAVLLDEIAFFRTDDESSNPDSEIVAAIRPAMATIPNAMLLAASSPYARRGTLFDAYCNHFGKDHDAILVVQADTRSVNPVVDAQIVADAYDADPISAAAEYGAQFRSDIESYVSLEVVTACVSLNVYERPPVARFRYSAFTDPSGGSSDSFALAIAHRDGDSVVLDCVREVRPPFSPTSVAEEFAGLCKGYGIKEVQGDRYAGEWPREQFKKCGVKYEVSAKPKSDMYRDVLPLLNSRRIQLLDNRRLITQLSGLERRTARSGRDSIDHSPGSHDDVANAAAGALLAAFEDKKHRLRIGVFGYGGPVTEIDPDTGRPLGIEPARIRWVRVDERDVGPAKGP